MASFALKTSRWRVSRARSTRKFIASSEKQTNKQCLSLYCGAWRGAFVRTSEVLLCIWTFNNVSTELQLTNVDVCLGRCEKPSLDADLLTEPGHYFGLHSVAGDVALVGKEHNGDRFSVGQR